MILFSSQIIFVKYFRLPYLSGSPKCIGCKTKRRLIGVCVTIALLPPISHTFRFVWIFCWISFDLLVFVNSAIFPPITHTLPLSHCQLETRGPQGLRTPTCDDGALIPYTSQCKQLLVFRCGTLGI